MLGTDISLVSSLNPAARSKSLLNGGHFIPSSGHTGFSMSEEARNTDRRGGWGATSLRSQAISFVSAGPLKREEDAWNTTSEDDGPQKVPENEVPADTTAQESQDNVAPIVSTLQTIYQVPNTTVHTQSEKQESTQHTETTDVLPTEMPDQSHVAEDPVVLTPPTPSSESDEEIVFAGRSVKSQRPSRRPTPAPVHATSKDTTEEQPTVSQPVLVQEAVTAKTTTIVAEQTSKDKSVVDRTRSKRPDKDFDRLPFGRKYTEDELMQDYIENMALGDSSELESGEVDVATPSRKPFRKTETFRMFNGDGLENAKVQTTGKTTQRTRTDDLPIQAIDWDSDELADFDDLSTTDEEVEDIGQVIRHRTRIAGNQYLVIADGAEAGDAKWMLHSRLVSESAIREIEIYEEIRKMNIEEDDFDDESDDDSEEEDQEALQDLIDTIESEDDENARIMHYTSRMTDEQIARALAKQEELGLGSDELMLFDGEVANGRDRLEPASDDAFGAGEDFIPFSISKHTSNRGRSKRNKKQRDSFPSAEAFADALDQDPYGAFDVMDFERPSLRPKKKGRKSDFPWDLEDLDDDLRDQLVNTWTKDREKKAERKRQKEEARLLASLDAEDQGDPAVIKTLIRQFLIQDVDVLKLSPMDAHIRASVHRLAKALKLNSRSEGKEGLGLGRYPVLTKTPRTPYYSAETIWEIDNLMNQRKYFPKSSGHFFGKKTPRVSGSARPKRSGGGGVMAGATYRDGEEVGASAPELGADNKGRAMLEKMGWTVGMGIGAEGNKGSLDHVKHIVKTTKAGLG